MNRDELNKLFDEHFINEYMMHGKILLNMWKR